MARAMSLYRYEAVDKAGKIVRGAMDARTEQQVAQRLTQMGYTPRAITSAASGISTTPHRTASAVHGVVSQTPRAGVPVSVRPDVPLAALAAFFRHLATMVRSGMPLRQALGETQGVVRNRRLAAAVSRAMEATSAGGSLSGMMAQSPRVFPVHAVASVWAGELAGRLEVALSDVAADLESEAADARYGRIGWWLTGLSVLSLILAYPVANLGNLLVPVFQKMLDSAGKIDNAAALRMLGQQYASKMLLPSLAACLVFIVAWVIWGRLKRVPALRRILDDVLLRVPVWGPLHRARGLARFFTVLDHLYSAGVAPQQAWDAASLVPRNSAMAHRLRLAPGQLSGNPRVSDLLAVSGVAGSSDSGLAASGEKAGRLPEVLANLATHYDNEAAALRIKARAAGVLALTMFSIIGTGFILLRFAIAYRDLPFKLADMIGAP